MARPNSTESPNIPADTNRRPSPATPPAPATPATRDAIEAVVDGYDRMMHRLIQGHATEFTEVGITMTQAKVLYVVMAAGRLRMSELAARLGIGSSSATELADRLVEVGLLSRHADPDDRRQVVVTVTPEAEALLERFRELNLRQLRELLGRLDADELAVVDRSLVVLNAAIDRAAIDPVPVHAPPTHHREKHP